jgi:glucan phosphoethanolaminetransferase (alkaline phosphatase superfamily)
MTKEFRVREFVESVVVGFFYLMISLLMAIFCVYLVNHIYPINLGMSGSIALALGIMALYFIADLGLLYLKKPFLTVVIIALIMGAVIAVYKLFYDYDTPTLGKETPDELSNYVFWKRVFC